MKQDDEELCAPLAAGQPLMASTARHLRGFINGLDEQTRNKSYIPGRFFPQPLAGDHHAAAADEHEHDDEERHGERGERTVPSTFQFLAAFEPALRGGGARSLDEALSGLPYANVHVPRLRPITGWALRRAFGSVLGVGLYRWNPADAELKSAACCQTLSL